VTGDRATTPPGLDDDSSAVRVLSRPFERATLLDAIAHVLASPAG